MATTVLTEIEDAPAAPDETVPTRRSRAARSAPMLTFLARRILSSLFVLLGATFIVFMLFSYSVDPLEDLRFSTAPNVQQLIAERVAALNLDVPPVVRYFQWLGNVVTGDLGTSWRTGQSVSSILGAAIPNTVTLVSGALVLAIGLGVLVGIVAALRQYTRFDYAVTFLSFVLFSLPSFWVAVLLKLWGAIGFNDFLRDPTIAWYWIVGLSVLSGGLWSAIIGGVRRTRWVSFAAATVATGAILAFVSETDWIVQPSLGYVGIAVLGAGVAFAVVALTAGLSNRRALYASLTAAAVGVALKLPLQFLFVNASWVMMLGLAVAAVACGCLIGWLFGGDDRRVSMRAAAVTALGTGLFLFVDRVMQVWYAYNRASQINFRPISTIGSQTPGLRGDFWITTLDQFTHILLPTITLVLISFAGYTRYTRASMLEVMNQDYIRTARSKGLSERVVTVRHAFRNALIPLATIVPLDVAAMFGGAIITERIFAWSGMGSVFITALQNMDADVIMGHFLVVGSLLVVASILVDFIYAALDPRIRVNA
ncbi:MAG: ABC transporter permease subunit [Promicromonosporaceae bacterium]|nr:ABC transporter permease subunit [Promicromonosporaceae bacterium]